MNGLALRIRPNGGERFRSSIGFSPITIPHSIFTDLDERYPQIQSFINSTTTDEQLSILRRILDTDPILIINDEAIIKFLVITFWLAEPKHPIKCFITRHVTRIKDLQQPFTEALAAHISEEIATVHEEQYDTYTNIVNATVSCLENFPPGQAAVKMVELPLAQYLQKCLQSRVQTIREKSLSPTEKNDMFNLIHKTVRLLHHILQNTGEEPERELPPIYYALKLFIQDLMFDDDVPMDTKSLCGLLYLGIYCLEYGPDSWIDILSPDEAQGGIASLLSVDAARLSLLSALVNVVDVAQLSTVRVEHKPAIVALTEEILIVAERNFSESVMFLGVARTLLVISKVLDRIPDRGTGVVIVDHLLKFAWSHLEHHMDSVRHQVGQMVGFVVNYAAWLEGKGDSSAIKKILSGVSCLDMSRKSYHVYVACLATALPPRRLIGDHIHLKDVLASLQHQHVQSTASTALNILLEKFSADTSASHVNNDWIRPMVEYVNSNDLDVGALGVIEGLISKALQMHPRLDDYIIAYIGPMCGHHDRLKTILMLLRVARRSGIRRLSTDNDDMWKGFVPYKMLRKAAVDAVDDTRILSLSLVVESPKSTEVFTEKEIKFVLYFLKYNINAQAPNFRQLTLSMLTKFIKRLDESYKVLHRTLDGENLSSYSYYVRLLEQLRAYCYQCLVCAANYGRRHVALKILALCTKLYNGHAVKWEREYIEKLLLHLEDSFEANKILALEVLRTCPIYMIQGHQFSTSLKLKDILRQASSINPTDCTSAAYKLEFVMDRLPDEILVDCRQSQVDPVRYGLLWILLSSVQAELAVCRQSVVRAAAQAPMYGLLHCTRHILKNIPKHSISEASEWHELIGQIISTCMEVNSAVACVVNNSSPEGHLPCDMSTQITDYGNSSNITLEDGRLVTAQMVLLCAWRSVKEVSLILGALSASCYITGEERETPACTLSVEQVMNIGQHFTTLLAETKHRGAFEQAYVGFTQLLARLWRCRSPRLHSLPREWVSQVMSAISSADGQGVLCATRRSAGLPFMIQALVSTELQVSGNPACFHSCMQALLSLCSTALEETRTHALNMLRALFRASALDHAVLGYVGAGLMAALRGFDGDTWAERNSSTLLFSALMVRIFGVQRSRDSDDLCVRNRMTGRIFFLRYPQLYDFMLEKLREVTENDDTQVLRPSLYPILLLLARLYPSSLEGTVSNLKLVAFIPHVLSCAKSSVMKTRQLAAKAIVPLIAPELYLRQMQTIFGLLHDVHIKRNNCHGLLLIIERLLDKQPSEVKLCEHVLTPCVEGSVWILEQATGDRPCYLITDRWCNIICTLLYKKVPLPEDILANIASLLQKLLFKTKAPNVSPGREACLTNVVRLYFSLKRSPAEETEYLYKVLQHPCYDVILSVLHYIRFIVWKKDDPKYKIILRNIRTGGRYYQLLQKLTNSKQLQVKQQALEILSQEDNTYKYIVEDTTPKAVIEKLTELIQNSTSTMNYIYLEILLKYVSDRIRDFSVRGQECLKFIRVMFKYCRCDSQDRMRTAVVNFLERNLLLLISPDIIQDLSDSETFEYLTTAWVINVILLEDQEHSIRQKMCDIMYPQLKSGGRVVPALCVEVLLHSRCTPYSREDGATLAVTALIDFKTVVLMNDELNDECRVFDQNEKYNVYLEETVLTKACADIIRDNLKFNLMDICSIIDDEKFHSTFHSLCGDNVIWFKKMVAGEVVPDNEAVNPKVKLFLETLSLPREN